MSGLLPIPSIPTPGPGLTGPDFDFSDQIKLPAEIGVQDGDSMESVVNAVKGVSFYIDTIGFGAPTLPLSSGMDIRPIGVNFWSKTGLKCSNGADMWSYTETIPKGDALGKRVQAALGGTQLRGLAPGIVEDAKSALNPVPLMKAIFGSGYPLCKLEEKQVGDQDGYIQKRKTLENGRLESTPSGPYFIDQPESAYKKADGKFYQKRWTYAADLTEIQWQNAQKTHCPDGFPMKNHRNGRCELPLVSSVLDGFQSTSNPNTKILLGIAILGSLVTLKYIAKSHK